MRHASHASVNELEALGRRSGEGLVMVLEVERDWVVVDAIGGETAAAGVGGVMTSVGAEDGVCCVMECDAEMSLLTEVGDRLELMIGKDARR